MNNETLKQFENLFLELKKNTLNEMKQLENFNATEKGDDVDLYFEEKNREMNLKLLGRQNFMLKKIDNALFKIKNGTYGICDECDGEIDINRLRARPVANQCITCKEANERTEDQIKYEKRSHTQGIEFYSNVIQLRPNQGEELNNVVLINDF